MTKRVLVFLYGVAAYALFFGVSVYVPDFIGGFVAPKSIDSVPQASFAVALFVNTLLFAVFAALTTARVLNTVRVARRDVARHETAYERYRRAPTSIPWTRRSAPGIGAPAWKPV